MPADRNTRESLWPRRRELAGWVLQTTRMAKSGYAPKKAELAQWVIEASREIEQLQGRLDRLDAALAMMRVGRETRDESTFTRDEFYAAHGQDSVIEIVKEALRAS